MDINGHKRAIFHIYVSLPECNPIQLYGETRLSEGLMLGESINTMCKAGVLNPQGEIGDFKSQALPAPHMTRCMGSSGSQG